MIADIVVGLIAAVAAIVFAADPATYGWRMGVRTQQLGMYVSAAVLAAASLLFVGFSNAWLRSQGLPGGLSVWVVAVIALGINAIVWHDILRARRKSMSGRSNRSVNR